MTSKNNIAQISHNIWCISRPLSLFKTNVGTRASIIKLTNNKIIIHSPINFTDNQLRFINSQGVVSDIIAPNCFHHLFLHHASTLFPKQPYILLQV